MPLVLAPERDRIEEIDIEVWQLEARIRQLEYEREKLQSRLDAYKYPVLTIPNELLGEIFVRTYLLALAADSTLYARAMVQHTAGIVGPRPTISETHGEVEATPALHTWVQRAGNFPLNFFNCSAYVLDDTSKNLIPAIANYRPQWGVLSLDVMPAHLGDLSEAMPQLSALYLTGVGEPTPSPVPLRIGATPLLSSVDLWDIPFDASSLRWDRLTELSLVQTPQAPIVAVLRLAHRLVHCRLRLTTGLSPNLGTASITLPLLETFIIERHHDLTNNYTHLPTPYHYDITMFVLPSLRRLCTTSLSRIVGDAAPWMVREVQGLLERSKCQLEVLRFFNDLSLSLGEAEISHLRQMFPQIKQIDSRRRPERLGWNARYDDAWTSESCTDNPMTKLLFDTERARLVQLHESMASFEKGIKELENLMAPLRSEQKAIQAELAAEIFLRTLPDPPAAPPLLGLAAPQNLLGVCTQWRAIALATHGLWKRTHLPRLYGSNKLTLEQMVAAFGTWLLRSNGPIALSWTSDLQSYNIRSLVALLPAHRQRWQGLNLELDAEDLHHLSGPAPRLVQFYLAVSGDCSRYPALSLRPNPLLRSVGLSNVDYDAATLRWETLTELSILWARSLEGTFAVLSLATSLVHCRLHFALDNSSETTRTAAVLPHLETLIVEPEEGFAVLTAFAFPNLRRLLLSGHRLPSAIVITHLRQLMESSKCPLKTLWLTTASSSDPGWYDWTEDEWWTQSLKRNSASD
ncbi:hypothetical protein MKEN_00025800 [Mycena kentingensis (nom. inval.)]|nr:hypothetical protein MKEN_00025800 [Mycena kentingensis (nom. inval.)]